MKYVFSFLAIAVLQGCASLSSNGDYARSSEYLGHENLKDSVSVTDGQTLSQEEIRTLLSSKVDLKRPLKIAVVKTDNLVARGHRRSQSLPPAASPESTQALKGVIEKSKFVKDISFVPRFMMPKDFTIKNLRDVAAVMQADLVLILFTRTEADSKFILMGADKAKAVSTLESMLVDVRTGAIPFTAIATGTARLEKDKSQDFSEDDFRSRTIVAAEDKAVGELAHDLLAYIQ